MAQGVGGGTKIGECLAAFNRWHARRVIHSRTCVMILSDGYDTGAPEALAAAMRALRRRCRRIVWLNPLMGRDGYRAERARHAGGACRSSISSRRRTASTASRRSNPIWRGFDMGVLERAAQRQANGEVFALATVVRTVSVTAAKAGAKALIARGRRDRGRLDRRRVRARRGAEGGATVRWSTDNRGWSPSRRRSCWPNSGFRRARIAPASSTPRTVAPARERWTFLSNRCCRRHGC